MRSFLGFASIAQLVSAAVDVNSVDYSPTAQVVPNSYIVELSPNSYLKRGYESPHEELRLDLQRLGAKWNVITKYLSDVLTGAVVQLGSNADLVKLAKAQGVKRITPNYFYPPPEVVSQKVKKVKMDKRDDTSPLDALWAPTHTMTGVDKLHDERYFGEGIKIGIIDSGIDYTHPALGGGLGPGNKIIGGHDFVGDAYTGHGGPLPTPDNDPLDRCNGHGTHVAGIIGSSPNNRYGISGVAYKSQINAYRVFGCTGGVSEDILIEALLRADRDGNDVITVSIGKSKGWTRSIVGDVASRIADKGRIVTVSAGSDGASGACTGPGVISVGSVDNTVAHLQNAIVNKHKISYLSFEPLQIPPDLLIYATSNNLDVVDDACNPLTNTPSLSHWVVLIQSGGCSLVTKFNNAAARGARYFLVYDKEDPPLRPITVDEYTYARISLPDARFLLDKAIPRKYKISFPNSPSTSPVPSSGLMSSFSSYGPSYDMHLGPALTAPGGLILSTMPVTLGSWGIKSGTSLAASYVAGSAALLLQARGKTADIGKAARAIFQNTANPVGESIKSPLVATAAHQGAGLLNIYNAVKNTGSLLPSELLLNDTAYFRGKYTLELHNRGEKSMTYIFSHVPAGTALTIRGINAESGPVPLIDNSAIVTFRPNDITVPAHRTSQIVVTFKPPNNLDSTTFPVYSGYIKAIGSDGTTLQSTYLGLAAKLKEAKVFDNTNARFGHELPLLMDGADNVVSPTGSATYTMSGNSVPIVVYRLAQGTPLLLIDLIDSESHFETNQRRSSGVKGQLAQDCKVSKSARSALSGRGFLSCFNPGTTFDRINIRGELSRKAYRSRHSSAKTLKAGGFSRIEISHFSNGVAIENGSYRVLLRALRISGDPKKNQDYETWTSPKIVIERA